MATADDHSETASEVWFQKDHNHDERPINDEANTAMLAGKNTTPLQARNSLEIKNERSLPACAACDQR
jgi:hypothetical protein